MSGTLDDSPDIPARHSTWGMLSPRKLPSPWRLCGFPLAAVVLAIAGGARAMPVDSACLWRNLSEQHRTAAYAALDHYAAVLTDDSYGPAELIQVAREVTGSLAGLSDAEMTQMEANCGFADDGLRLAGSLLVASRLRYAAERRLSERGVTATQLDEAWSDLPASVRDGRQFRYSTLPPADRATFDPVLRRLQLTSLTAANELVLYIQNRAGAGALAAAMMRPTG
jgi:hypothetical protein